MKIILSRKGYDSSYGGGASPIMPNGDLLSIPIPSNEGERGIPYSEIYYGKRSYWEIMKELGLKAEQKLSHFDPDLIAGAYDRSEGWRGAFGQAGAALTHLKNNKVEPGDLFLFFGSFKRTFERAGKLQFERDYERHIIFGYLKVGEILEPTEKEDHTAFKDHPHVQNRDVYHPRNLLYIANNEKDYGVFKYRDELVLTRNGFSKSQWELPMAFDLKRGTTISRHSERDIAIRDGKVLLNSRGIGQDFVVEGNPEVVEWAERIIGKSTTF